LAKLFIIYLYQLHLLVALIVIAKWD